MSTDNKKNDDKNYPGYPHQPKGEDITNREEGISLDNVDNGEQRDVDAKLDKHPTSGNSNSDVTKEDIQMLSAADQNRDMDEPDLEEPMLDTTDADGEPLNEPQGSYGKQGADLDVPGSAADDQQENVGSEDEENNYYSLGGDNHENLEEDNTGQ